jgi:hypothetical protein
MKRLSALISARNDSTKGLLLQAHSGWVRL